MANAPTAQAGHQATATLPVPEVVRKLEQARTALADVDVDLADHIPSIVVIGDQSTGKSSLLSALTQLQLPTGDNIVTRAPLKIFIRPGTEHQATLQYRLHKADGSLERRSVHLSAADLQANPERVAEAIRTAQEEMYNSLKATAPSHWKKYVLGDLDKDNNDDSWLLKDEIELFVDMPDEKGSFTVVDLPGLYRPVGQKQFTQDLEEWVTEKIKRDNVIILSAMTAAIAVDGGSGNLSVANTLAYDVDKEHRRTLDIITKADTVVDKIPYVLKAAVARSKPGTCTGCVLVAINPSGFRTEEECLQQFGGAEVAKLMDAGGGLGVRHLFGKLVQLQEAMVLNLNWSSLIKKLQKKLDALDSELAECKDLPITEADAVRDVERRLGLAAQSFCNACINAPATDESGDITSTMIEGVYAAGQRYIKKQSDFIPGILGKKEVLEIIMKATEIDTMANLPDELSEYTAVKLFLVFHKRVASYAVEYVGEAHEAVEEAIIGLLRLHLREQVHPNLASAAVDAAKEVLKKYKKLLCAAVEDVTHAFSYVVEPLHTQVLYLTYRRQLLLASGILVDPQDFEKVEQAAKVEAAKHIKQRSESDASGTGLDQFKRERAAQEGTGSSAGPSNTGAIVGSVVGDISAIALSLTPAGPFAGPLGMGIAYLISQAWDAFRDALHKYKTAYNCKKEKYKSKMEQLEGVCADYKAADFQINLVPLLWPADKDPMTSFELMCNMMNCDPGYVVEALEFYYTAFGQQLKEQKLARSFSAVDLQKALIGCLCRMLCSHYAMTESVAKLVRMRLMSTHTYVLSPDAAMPDLSLPTQLRELLRDELEAQHEGGLLPLLAGKENIARVKKLQKQKQGMEEAIKLVKACLPVK